jgi:hypothetical protein
MTDGYVDRLLAETLEQAETMEDLGAYEDEVVNFAANFRALSTVLSDGAALPQQWQTNRRTPGRKRRVVDGAVVLQDRPHGNRDTYARGCQCVPCTAANRIHRNLTPEEMLEYQLRADQY